MRSTKLVIGGAAAGALGVRVARSLYGRWRLLPPVDRERIAAFAEDTKEKAETAESNPEVSAEDVQQLRDELRRELDRLSAVGERRAAPGAQPPLSGR